VETGVLVGAPGAYRLAPPVGASPRGRPDEGNHRGLPLQIDIQIPATVQAVLAARIDRLALEDKRLLQTAAVIGTEVPFALLRAIADLPEEALHRGLEHLQAAEFLYETRLFPTFKHALTHEVAYGSLLLERRRGLHARLVEAIEALASDREADVAAGAKGLSAGKQGPDQVERLAYHALRGEVWDKAVTYFQQAGVRAYNRAAFGEALAAFEQALQAIAHLPEHGDTRVLALELRLAVDSPLNAMGEHGRRLALLGEAEALARGLDDRARLGRVLSGRANAIRQTGDPDGAIAAGQQALTLSAALGERALQEQASYNLGGAYYAIGDFSRAAELLRRNVEAADRESGRPSTERLGHSPRAGPTGRRRSASPRWQAEETHRSLLTPASASCTSPKGIWSPPSGCWSRAWLSVVPPATGTGCQESRRA
jgi:tetratricopeptide (TPR) repeat protein